MRVISIAPLKEFWEKHNQAEQPLRAWVDEVRKATWHDTHDIRNKFNSADFVGNNRVIFNIKGNDYRLVVAVAYKYQAVYVKFVGTHAEYDRIDASTVEL